MYVCFFYEQFFKIKTSCFFICFERMCQRFVSNEFFFVISKRIKRLGVKEGGNKEEVLMLKDVT